MLSNFIVAISAVVPIFVLILIGLYVRYRAFLSADELRRVNKMVFQVFFSVMMFYNLYLVEFDTAVHPDLMLFAAVAVLLIAGVSTLVVCFFEKENYRRGAMIQALYRSNYVIMGVPIVANVFGYDNVAVPTAMIAVIIPIYNVLAVIILETFRGGRISLWPVVLGILKNPMIQGAVLGIFCRLVGLRVPDPILTPIGQVAAATAPVALIILGASFEPAGLKAEKTQLVWCIIGRLIIVPAVMLSLAAALGFRGVDFVTLIAIFTTPCAIASFTMAQQMGSDGELAGGCVVFTSALSCITMFGWIFLSKSLGMF